MFGYDHNLPFCSPYFAVSNLVHFWAWLIYFNQHILSSCVVLKMFPPCFGDWIILLWCWFQCQWKVIILIRPWSRIILKLSSELTLTFPLYFFCCYSSYLLHTQCFLSTQLFISSLDCFLFLFRLNFHLNPVFML